MQPPLEPPFSSVQTQAEALAGKRHEQLSQVHFLVSLAAMASGSRSVLEEHGAGARRVLDQWERRPESGPPENLVQLAGKVRDTARRYGALTPSAPHLLLVLLNDPNGAGRRLLDRMGVDVPRLRASVVPLLQGIATRRPMVAAVASALPGSLPLAAETPAPKGVAIPVMPERPVRGPRAGLAAPEKTLVRGAGQALPIIPQVGPVPLPHERIRQKLDADSGASVKTVVDAALGGDPLPLSSECAPREDAPSSVDDSAKASLYGRFGLPPKKFPILTSVGRNLTLQAALGDLDPVVGREAEIEQALDVLAKRQGNNPCLIGASGVGKTAVARGIAASFAGSAGAFEERIVIEIPISELFAGTGVRGALAGRLGALKKEVSLAEGRVVLFFDEIHQLFSGEAAEEIASDLKVALSRGELPCIGATSGEEFRRVIERDPALSRRFSAVEIEEPSREDAYLILSSVSQKLEKHHRVRYDEEALALSIAWSMRYLPGRALPDKAVSVVDLAGARCRRRGKGIVDAEAVAEVVAGQASMPVERLLEADSDRMLGLEEILSKRVIGHEDQIRKIARILRRNAAGLGSRRPIGTFLLLGPTGVGKTETAKAIAEVLFHSESAMTRIDMAEMSEAHAVSKLVGAPPGYVGHDSGGQLTEAVRRRPYQVLLLDEIEKAHPEVLTAFLAVFDEGRMTDSRGRTVDFTNTVIILTSNLGATECRGGSRKRVGFGAKNEDAGAEVSSLVVEAARAALPPELYNRLDEVLAFAPLTRADVRKIGEKLVAQLAREVWESRGIIVRVESEALELLLDLGGFDPELGARPLRRTLARRVEAPLAEAILSGDVGQKDEYRVRVQDGALVPEVRRSRERAAE